MSRFPPFKLDTLNHCVWKEQAAGQSERLELAPKTFDVLRYLVESGGRLVSHDELLDALWPDSAVQPEVLKGHILAIRTALGDDARNPQYIATQRGRGYRFIAPSLEEAPVERAALPAFVGREPELAALHAALELAAAGRPRMVFVNGEPGIGKTLLIERFLEQATAGKALRVATGHSIESYATCEPYFPIFEALIQLAKNDSNVLGALLSAGPSWALQLPGLLSPEKMSAIQRKLGGLPRNRLLGEFCDFVELLTVERPLVLVLEDLHWADFSTLDLLSAIARRDSTAKLLIVASYRKESALHSRHPIGELVRKLQAYERCTELRLPPLSQAELSALIAADSSTAHQALSGFISRQAGGNPLFVTLILDHLQQQKLVQRGDAGWELLSPVEKMVFTTPATLSNIVELQAAQLSVEQQTLLECASIAGATFDAASVAALEKLDEAAVEHELEALSHSSMFIGRGEIVHAEERLPFRRYQFRHATYQSVFHERQAPMRRARRHLAAAHYLAALPPGADQLAVVAELARHYEAGADHAQALAQLRILLGVAKKRFGHRDAIAIVERAEAIMARRPAAADSQEMLSWLEEKASGQAASHDPAAQASYELLVQRAAQLGAVETHVRALLGLAFVYSWRDAARCLALLDQALQAGETQQDAMLRARTRMSCHVWKIWVGGWDREAAQECEQLMAIIRAGSDQKAVAWSMVEYSMLCLLSTRYREGQEIIADSLEVLLNTPSDQPDYDSMRVIAMGSVGVPWTDLLQGKFGTALERFDSNIAMLEKNASPYAANRLRMMRALLFMHAQDFSAMLEECKWVMHSLDESAGGESRRVIAALPGERRTCQLMLGVAHAGMGNTGAAIRELLQIESEMLAQAINFDWHRLLLLEWALADAYLAQDDLENARLRADRFLARAQATDEVCWHALAWETIARLALRTDDLALAQQAIGHALHAIERHDIPLAAWRVYRTAAAVHARGGDQHQADQYAARLLRSCEDLAASLPVGHRLRSPLTGG